MAQSALSAAVFRSRSISPTQPGFAVPASIASSSCATRVSPTRQGTHLPQVCDRHCHAYAAHWPTGQFPAGAALLLRALSS